VAVSEALAIDVFQRWIDALHDRGDGDRLRAVMIEGGRVDRYAPAPTEGLAGELEESFVGLVQVSMWLRRTPVGIVFGLVGSPTIEGTSIRAEYSIRIDDFVNGGLWIARIASHQIEHLEHRPRALLQ